MTPITRCPKCNFNNPQPITKSADRYYCPKCKCAWVKGEEQAALETEGDLKFDGVGRAKNFIHTFLKNSNLTPEIKTAVAAEMTAVLFDQWFDGFKTGLMAEIVHLQEIKYDGKNSTESGTTNRERGDGVGSSNSEADKDGLREQSNVGAGKAFTRVKEQVAGVTFIRPKALTPTEKQYSECAYLLGHLGENKKNVSEVYFDGVHLQLKYKI